MTPEEKETISQLSSLLNEFITDLREVRTSISKGFEKCDTNFSEIHTKIDLLSGETHIEFKEVSMNLLSIKEEIEKISEFTSYEGQINNLKLVSGGKAV